MNSASFQGEHGAYSEQAARTFLGKKTVCTPCRTFDDVFALTGKTKGMFGVIPIENSIFGSVHPNYDLFLRYRLHIVGELAVRIEHNLMTLPGVAMKDVREIYSHPQALGQCEHFLKSMKRAVLVPYYDTAGAAKMIREEGRRDAAAVASAEAADVYALRIHRRNIESDHRNFTRFLVLSTKPYAGSKASKTTLAFSLKNKPGALFHALAVFALREINMLKIESRPLPGSPWEYLFYADLEGGMHEQRMKQAINHLREATAFVRILGSYPQSVRSGQ